MRLSCAVAVSVSTLTMGGALLSGGPALAAEPYAMKIRMSGDHARPLPGERQTYRLAVENSGRQPLRAAWVSVKPPGGWAVDAPESCRAEDDRIVCSLGDLSSGESGKATIRMTVPAAPRFGKARISAWSGAATADGTFEGPSTSLTVEVVRDRPASAGDRKGAH